MRLSIRAAITVDVARRSLIGTVYRYGEVGQTSAGPLAVSGTMPPPPIGLPVTFEHDRGVVRGTVALVDNTPERLRIAVRVVDGDLGDQALTEAANRTRAGFSFDIEDTEVIDGVIVSGRWEAVGQVENPAFNSARIDQIAANHRGVHMLTAAQRARLTELLAIDNPNAAEQSELTALLATAGATPPADPSPAAVPAAPAPVAAEPAPAATPAEPSGPVAVAASVPAVPAGVPSPAGSAQVQAPNALRSVVTAITNALRPGGGGAQAITAALSDITHSEHTGHIEPVAWSGELWSGLQYVPQFTDLFTRDTLTYWEGKGWRFTSKLEIKDYAGDKAEIPTSDVTTETSEYEASRMAVGVDIDRKFYDFPNEGFIASLLAQVRESWEIKLDTKVAAYVAANKVAATRGISVTKTNGDATITAATGTFKASDVGATITGTGIPASTTIASVTNSGSAEMSANATSGGTITATLGVQEATLLKAAGRVAQALKRRKVGNASWIYVNDEDLFSLMDLNEDAVPAFLKLFNINPENFRSSPDLAPGEVLGGVKQAATLRTLPGSPIRVSAQNLAHGGVDEAFFGYWAIEEHHTSGIASVKFVPSV